MCHTASSLFDALLRARTRRAFLLWIAVCSMSTPVASAQPADVLMLESSLRRFTDNSGTLTSDEENAATALGLTVDIKSAEQWREMTTAEFSAYRAIILGDPDGSGLCGNTADCLGVAIDTREVWSPAVNGNVLVFGSDPSGHSNAGAFNATRAFIGFAADQPGRTGLYLATSDSSDAPTKISELLSLFGSFAFTNDVAGNDVQRVCPQNRLFPGKRYETSCRQSNL